MLTEFKKTRRNKERAKKGLVEGRKSRQIIENPLFIENHSFMNYQRHQKCWDNEMLYVSG
jgi:hypothetical protein